MKAGNVFRAYDIRGVVDKDFDEAWVQRLGQAMGTYFVRRGIHDVVLGYDCRHSSPAYHVSLTRGLLSTGVDVVSVGMVPTPVLYFAVTHLERTGGVMITASHNPSEYNGFKVWAGTATIHGDEILRIKALFEAQDFEEGQGIASTFDVLPAYKEAVLERVRLKRPLKVVVDGGNGAGGEICAELLQSMGADVIPLYCDPHPDFPNHHPDPVVAANMQDLMAKVLEEKADFGIGLDGDADRLGVVDDTGRLLYGDELLSLYARELLQRKPGVTIMGDVKCSERLFDDIKKHGGTPLMWTTGHSIIKAKMQSIKCPLAGEMSGHMFFSDNWYGFDDAIYGAARFLDLFSAQNVPLSALPGWPSAFSTSEINIPCPDDVKFAVVEKAKAHFKPLYETTDIDGARVRFADGWGLIRASNTQPVLVTRFEAKSEEALAKIRSIMETPLKEWIHEAGSAKGKAE